MAIVAAGSLQRFGREKFEKQISRVLARMDS
jgi:hypothetical protein